jgi:hypothetical protein
MGLNTEERQGVVYFTGYEVEHTICHGMKTLFVVGTPSYKEIKAQALAQNCKHIYYGTSQSFNPQAITTEEYKAWDKVILSALKDDFWVTLDFGVEHIEGVLESAYNEYPRFVPMISVKLPYINQLNYNATLKLDDRTWGATNPGVWTHQLNELMTKDKYTHWDQYTQDETIK